MARQAFAVITIDDNRKILCHKVTAESGLNAFRVFAKKADHDFEAVVALPWKEFSARFEFPGESVVDKATILDQPEVFGNKGEIEYAEAKKAKMEKSAHIQKNFPSLPKSRM